MLFHGYALGEQETSRARDVLADVLAVSGDAPGLHWDELAHRWPDRWADVTGDAMSVITTLRSRAVSAPRTVLHAPIVQGDTAKETPRSTR